VTGVLELPHRPRRADRDEHANDWTRELTVVLVAMVWDAHVGDLAGLRAHVERRRGRPLPPKNKARLLDPLCTFIRDLHAWGWCANSSIHDGRWQPRVQSMR
jgi:hypothetical protein